jgi:FtsH-binding integral membrane protein
MMAAFTLCESYLVTYICAMYTAASVLLAASATFAATVGLTYYAATSKEDFTSVRFVGKGILYNVVWIVMAVSLINLFFIRSDIVTITASICWWTRSWCWEGATVSCS